MKNFILTLCAAGCVCLFAGAEWKQFRGGGQSSVAADVELPTKWTGDAAGNVAWKSKLPGRGPSGPILVDGAVIVTCSGGVKQDRLYVISFDEKTGKENWRREFWATGRTSSHPTSANAAPTPASDGKRIFAFFSSSDLICLDLQGNLLWYRGLAIDYPKAGNDVGMASSPLVVGDTVIVQSESQGDSFVEAVNAATGETRWHKTRDQRANWSSPTLVPASGKRPDLVLLQSPDSGLNLVKPDTGEVMWSYKIKTGGIPSAAVRGDWIFVSANGLTAFQFGEDSTSPELKWDESAMQPGTASPIVHEDSVYVVKGGVLSAAEAATGKRKWKVRVGGTYWSTPVVADGKMYMAGYDGSVRVVDLSGAKAKVAAENEMNGKFQGSPAVGADAMYLRSDGYLWKISAN